MACWRAGENGARVTVHMETGLSTGSRPNSGSAEFGISKPARWIDLSFTYFAGDANGVLRAEPSWSESGSLDGTSTSSKAGFTQASRGLTNQSRPVSLRPELTRFAAPYEMCVLTNTRSPYRQVVGENSTDRYNTGSSTPARGAFEVAKRTSSWEVRLQGRFDRMLEDFEARTCRRLGA